MSEKKIYYVGAGILGVACAFYAMYKYDSMKVSQIDTEAYQQSLRNASKNLGKNTDESVDPKEDAEMNAYGSLLEKIQSIKVKKALLEQEINLRNVENELNAVRKEAGLDSGSLVDIASMDNTSSDESYKFIMVKHQQGEWYATFSSGSRVYKVKTGDTLPGGYKVKEINEHGTILKKGKEEFVQVF